VNVSLFVPCYVDQLAPDVAWATLRVLERAGCNVHYDPEQGCCGQPFLNRGAKREALRLATRHLARFGAAQAIVSPSASCVATVRHRFAELGLAGGDGALRQTERTYELGEFLVRVLGKTALGARFPYRVAVLQSCHGLRELGLGTPSEAAASAAVSAARAASGASGGTSPAPASASPTEQLLCAVEDLTLVPAERPDECCGFGGAFSVTHPTLSGRMGRARLRSFADAGAEYVTGTDASCLLHLDGIRRREGFGPRAIHLAEILANGASRPEAGAQ
jgi:L-lactate dehydrogenase complex protein LldE